MFSNFVHFFQKPITGLKPFGKRFPASKNSLTKFFYNFGIWIPLSPTFHAHHVETKIIGNFISNIFDGYTILLKGCYFRITGANVKFSPLCQCKSPPILYVRGQLLSTTLLKIFLRMCSFWKNGIIGDYQRNPSGLKCGGSIPLPLGLPLSPTMWARIPPSSFQAPTKCPQFPITLRVKKTTRENSWEIWNKKFTSFRLHQVD